MKKHQYSIAMTAICILFGIIIGVQYNTVQKQKVSTENQRLSEAATAMKQLQEERDALERKNESLEQTIKEYEQGILGTDMMRREIEQLREFAGLTEITGGGIAVTMNDSSAQKSGNKNAYIVHAEDILAVLNELNSAGAKAVSINGQRIVGTSAVACAGSIVTVNGVRVAAPFEILAVGDAEVLQAALKFPGGVVDSLSPWGIEINIRKESILTIPAYTQTALWREAEEE